MCTGETGRPSTTSCFCWVYPHVYGGNRSAIHNQLFLLGLSPCVRGKPHPGFVSFVSWGSIPMCTGETRALPSALNA